MLGTPVFRMTKGITKRTRVCRCSRKRFLLVTNSTGRKLPPGLRLTTRCVAGVTLIVRSYARWNRQGGRTGTTAAVTCRAAACRARCFGHMLRMIKLHVESFIKRARETLQRRVTAVHIAVTDDAHRNSSGYELSRVASYAGFVTREERRRRIVFAFMAGIASQRCVALTGVLEDRVVQARSLRQSGKQISVQPLCALCLCVGFSFREV
jgi:hypothetical protein